MRASGSGTSQPMRARHRRSSALDRREQGRPRGVRRTSTSIHHGPAPTDRIEANFPFLSGHSRVGRTVAGRGSPPFWSLDTGVSEPPTRTPGHQAHSGISGPIPSRALERVGRRAKGDDRGLAARPAEWTALHSARRGHLWFGDIEIDPGRWRFATTTATIHHIRCTSRWARPCPGHRMAAPGRGRLF